VSGVFDTVSSNEVGRQSDFYCYDKINQVAEVFLDGMDPKKGGGDLAHSPVND